MFFYIYISSLFYLIIFTDVLIVIILPASISVAICRQQLEATSPQSQRAVIQTTLIDNLKNLRM